MKHEVSAEMQQCIQNCTNCRSICVQTIEHCLRMGGKHVEASHVKSLSDCADACRISADFMLRDSALYTQVCGVCAEACARCAESCAQFGDDAQMKACAEECRRCAASCREMAKMKM
ncbi:MAG: four-helix bundle copper-binding protein [Chloroflexota bacterium]